MPSDVGWLRMERRWGVEQHAAGIGEKIRLVRTALGGRSPAFRRGLEAARSRMAQRGLSERDVLYIMNNGHHEAEDDGNRQATARVRDRDARVIYAKQAGNGAYVLTVMWLDD